MCEALLTNLPPTLVLISRTCTQSPHAFWVHPTMHPGFDELYRPVNSSMVDVPHPVAESSS
jgi:hypothetical protein